MTATIVQVSVGPPRTLVDLDGWEFTSAVKKRAVTGRVAVTRDGVTGDRPADSSHGGPNMTVHAFAAAHYPWFEQRAGRAIEIPAFGENLTVAGVTEEDLRVGDEIRAGEA